MGLKYTENGGVAYNTTNSAVYDLFAFGAAYRKRTDEECIQLFKDAFKENRELALKCLFYIRDCRGGQGERRFFQVCMRWLASNYPDVARNLIQYIPEYGRYDDWFPLLHTPCREDVMEQIKTQLSADMTCKKGAVSLLAKWLPSENTSSYHTRCMAKAMRNRLGISARDYRKMLSKLRARINVLETLMSENRWDEIEFDKIPSKAGLIYKNAFARRDIIMKKYEAFALSANTKVNAKTLYPYEVVKKAYEYYFGMSKSNVDRAMINKYWENLPDYLNGADMNMMCVIDTSGSMIGTPMDVAISLGLYCAERIKGPLANHYISFASRPQLIKTKGVDFVEKVVKIYKTNLCDNTNLTAVFDLLLNTANYVPKEQMPSTLVVISDMEIDYMSTWRKDTVLTEMEKVRKKWKKRGLKLPKLIYWNVDARSNTILDASPDVSFVSGMSPIIFKSVLTGKTGWDLMLETITAERYNNIKI